ncbi:restriction endonuclease subunit S [Bacteroides pyogenes]|uniref:Restriction endonuclease subunit S n=3 Tax=Bacteroides pyogenes TaxID=310300 RepID=A0A5D3FI41_9BACE|nr:restriction endonuclease subunit S [Bacteroides pyogenes]TYK47450.1 restriction endonuclease subunit S [Bacteroides pyogenes]
MVSLQDIATINPKSDSLQNTFIYIDLEAVEKGELRKIQEIMREEAPSRAQRVIDNNDILFQCVRPYQKNNYIHKTQNTSNQQWVASTGYAQIRTTESPNYIYHLLNTDGFNRKVMVRCTGSSYPAINSEDLATIRFYFTIDKKEQLKISRLLDLLDERIATQNKIIDRLESLIRGINQYAFTSKGVNYKLEELCEIRSGYSGNQLTSKNGLKVSRIETISGHKVNMERVGYVAPFESSGNYRLQIGDILFSNINSVEYIGNTAFIDKDYNLYHGMNLLRLTPNKKVVMPFYLYLLLNTNRMLNHFKTVCNKAVSQASINQTELGKTVIRIPDLKAQKQICELFQALYAKLESESYAISLLQNQKQHLLRQMFI